MQTLVKTISTAIKNLVRTVKVSRYGKDDTVTGLEAMPYGEDSNPVAGMDAVYLELSSRKNKVIVGYINKQQIAAVGEKRIFSTDENGNIKFYVWLHADGTCEFNGSENHLAQFEGLQSAYDQLKADFDALVDKFNSHVHSGVAGGAATSGVPTSSASHSTGDILPAKLSNHLCP